MFSNFSRKQTSFRYLFFQYWDDALISNKLKSLYSKKNIRNHLFRGIVIKTSSEIRGYAQQVPTFVCIKTYLLIMHCKTCLKGPIPSQRSIRNKEATRLLCQTLINWGGVRRFYCLLLNPAFLSSLSRGQLLLTIFSAPWDAFFVSFLWIIRCRRCFVFAISIITLVYRSFIRIVLCSFLCLLIH